VPVVSAATWDPLKASNARKLTCFLLGLILFPASALAFDPPSHRNDDAGEFRAYLGRDALVGLDYRTADRLLTEALASTSLSKTVKAFAFANRGVARTYLNEFRGALDDFNAAVRLFPEEATHYNNRGNLLLRMELYQEAAKDFGTAIALLPNYGEAYNNRANALFLLKDYRGASDDYGKAIILMPMNPTPLNGRGRAQFALDRPAAAMRDFARAIDIDPRFGQGYLHRGDALLALGRYEEAASDYTKAIELGFDVGHAYLGRASAHAFLGSKKTALAELGEARKRDPKIAEKAPRIVSDLYRAIEENAVPELPLPVISQESAPACGDGEVAASNDLSPGPSEPRMIIMRASLVPPLSLLGVPEAVEPVSADLAVDCEAQKTRLETGVPIAAAPNQTPADPSVDQWNVAWVRGAGQIATHSAYPELRIRLETYGGGDPEALHWEVLTDELAGIGLLHYYAGTTLKGLRMEYVAIIDIELGQVLAIEPAKWGKRQAKWIWRTAELVVVDPDGVPSRIPLPNGEEMAEASETFVPVEEDEAYVLDGKDVELPERKPN
jgi:tetratricopeptide (TPR) repeat protein